MTNPAAPLQMLFVDDDRDNYVSLKHHLKHEFAELRCQVDIQYEGDPDRAYNLIVRRGKPYQIVIADLLFPARHGARPRPRGIEVIERARRSSRDTVIFAITQGDQDMPELESSAARAGADKVLRWGHLDPTTAYGGPRSLVKEIYHILCNRSLVDAGPELHHNGDPGIQLVLEDTDVTGTTVRLLIADLLDGKDPQHVVLSNVTGGASGAHVVRARVEFANGSQRTYLLKLDKQIDVLTKELKNAEATEGLYGNAALFVPYLRRDQPVTRNGWSAIGMVFAEGAQQLRDWILQPATAAAVPALMARLFLNGGLVDGYRSALRKPTETHPMQKLRLPAFRRVRVQRAIDLIEHSLDYVQPRLQPIPDLVSVIRGFVRNAYIGDISLLDIPVPLHLAEAHGDLHGGNILVSGSDPPVPMIIDLANFDTHHWASDVARLAADLLLRCMDRKTQWFSWGRFAAWRELCRAVGDLRPLPIPPEPHNEGVFVALDWIINKHREVLVHVTKPAHRWEWHIAFAEQLLRGTYSQHLSDPKRALALVAAYDELMSAREHLPNAVQRY
jgi:CheY-like chemotaxis protein